MCSLNVWLSAWGRHCTSTLACACVYFCVDTAAKTGQGHAVAGGGGRRGLWNSWGPQSSTAWLISACVIKTHLRVITYSQFHPGLLPHSLDWGMQARRKKMARLIHWNLMRCDWTIFFFFTEISLHSKYCFSEKRWLSWEENTRSESSVHKSFTCTRIFSFLTLFRKQIYSDWAIPMEIGEKTIKKKKKKKKCVQLWKEPCMRF